MLFCYHVIFLLILEQENLLWTHVSAKLFYQVLLASLEINLFEQLEPSNIGIGNGSLPIFQ
ncbi:hypothetical protein KC19_4G203900 [Ceratodon purpureus]|uniref:Uncharacterized protein n=1 Tax=Ceratodon purpureus TaxID=3225 RepID=A0A8T0ID57_CERPU|nr:hypothetical protein KC19_4G203900 [Ceratodon purpureus]